MTDWYSFQFGRPSPGRRTRDRRESYLRGGRDSAVERSGVRPGASGPLPPDWSVEATQARARAERQGQRRSARSEPTWVFPTGDPVVPVIDQNQPAESVPFSNLAGTDQTPTGDDFATWYENVRHPPLPMAVANDPSVDQPAEAPRHGLDPPTAPEATRSADLDEEWARAEWRAMQRWRRGEQTEADLTFAAIMGRRPGQPLTNTRRRSDGRIQQEGASYGDLPELRR